MTRSNPLRRKSQGPGYNQGAKYKPGDPVRRTPSPMGGRLKTGVVMEYLEGETNSRGATVHTYIVKWNGSKSLNKVQQHVLQPVEQSI